MHTQDVPCALINISILDDFLRSMTFSAFSAPHTVPIKSTNVFEDFSMQNLYKSVLPEFHSSVAYRNSSSRFSSLCFMVMSATSILLDLRALHFFLATLALDAAEVFGSLTFFWMTLTMYSFLLSSL